ncbi:MAG: tyrosine decarboxylase / aspartate 1-decarboxylase [Acidobacteriaceae bacterium]|jgi:glutamate/tyrosine decarboxylase-like PLP-dependent enzyme|nr:tyrosine decarboxylase / aspartate 1-decarboxylase [Acidobacteriaceae bacterium]
MPKAPSSKSASQSGSIHKSSAKKKSHLLDSEYLEFLSNALVALNKSFEHLPEFKNDVPGSSRLDGVLTSAAERLRDNYPYFHPLYAGQMLKPPHPVAQLAYALAMTINPNNHALDGGRATSAMEKEAVAQIAAIFGWTKFLGHLCGGGTMANLEALWVAGQSAPAKIVLASSQSHYTHERISKALQLPFETIASDARGRLDLQLLETRLKQGGVGTVVVTMGTTATGSVDPLHKILVLRTKYNFRIHADAAYGGYFSLLENLEPDTQKSFAAMSEADSIAIDPHKHGLQPYGCGCILFKDPGAGRWYKHNSPYTYFTSTDLHLGEISLECSRPGAAAAALWATQKLLPLTKRGEFASTLAKGREAARALHQRLRADDRFLTPFAPELDILAFALRAESVSAASLLSREIFEAAAKRDLHLALADLPLHLFQTLPSTMKRDRQTITCLRSVLMKPAHFDWLDQIWERILASVTDIENSKIGVSRRNK